MSRKNRRKIPPPGTATGGWYAINRPAGANEAEIRIYDYIGSFGITADTFVRELEAIDAERIVVRINTQGGEVTEGTAIYNALAAHPSEVIVQVDGVAASAGSFIAMSGDEIQMAENAYMMIHEARGGVLGEADEMRKEADILDKMNDNIAGMYDAKAGKGRKYWRNLMAEETWFTADEAKAEGLIDSVFTPEKKEARAYLVRAPFNFADYHKMPEAVREMWGVSPAASAAVQSQEVTAMPDNSSVAATANTSAAVTTVSADAPSIKENNVEPIQETTKRLNEATLQARFDTGKKTGFDEGVRAAVERCKAIQAACPLKPELVLAAFIGGQGPEMAKLTYDAMLAADKRQADLEERKDYEIARLNQLLAVGGHGGIIFTPADGSSAEVDPKIRAEQEWDRNPTSREGFSSKERYVAYRVAELGGQLTNRTK